MSYKLIGSLRSPFTRMCRLFFINNDIGFEFEIINYLEKKEDAEYLAKISPINKIPILMDGDQKIFDSRVIYNHIVRKHGLKNLSVDEENIVSAIQSSMDVLVNLFLFNKGGLKLDSENWYVQRQRERIPQTFEFILPWMRELNANKPADWNYPSMILYSFLDWAQFRELLDLKYYPEYLVFLEKFKDARGIKETDFRS
jgi:glutathione S-transferase